MKNNHTQSKSSLKGNALRLVRKEDSNILLISNKFFIKNQTDNQSISNTLLRIKQIIKTEVKRHDPTQKGKNLSI